MRSFAFIFAVVVFVGSVVAQVPLATAVQIAKAEDSRNYDAELEALFSSKNTDVRKRAALAAGRIGDSKAVAGLSKLVETDASNDVKATAMFAIGEIESIDGATAVVNVLDDLKASATLRGRAIEAAGKIAGANATHDDAKQLGMAIISALRFEDTKRSAPYENVVRLGMTALLRAKPAGADKAAKPFLKYSDTAIVADALNALGRLRSRDVNLEARELLKTSPDPVVRANAARVLGGAEAKVLLPELLAAATSDADVRVRVSAVRAVGTFRDKEATEKMVDRGNELLREWKASKTKLPAQTTELWEIAAALGRMAANTNHDGTTHFLNEFLADNRLIAPEPMIAMAAVSPWFVARYVATKEVGYANPNYPVAYAQAVGTLAALKDKELISTARENLRSYIEGMGTGVKPRDQAKFLMAMPDLTRAMAAFKPDNLDDILLGNLENPDVNMRAVAASLIGDRPKTEANFEALKKAFIKARLTDKHDNDAKLSMIDALVKLDKKASVGSLLMALDDPDYLIRKKAFDVLSDKTLEKDMPGLPSMLESARERKKHRVLQYSPISGTRLGQVLNTDADYRRALSRKNDSIKAVLTTEKGAFTIEFFPEDAPLTVDNWVRLARVGYFDGLSVHRVVPNFVMQDGDPRGDGTGGPGLSIRCEINMREYTRGAVGMALSGKDTGGSQWFVTHSPQPHLDGGYTVFGHVSEADMKVVDRIVRGDKILRVKIIGK